MSREDDSLPDLVNKCALCPSEEGRSAWGSVSGLAVETFVLIAMAGGQIIPTTMKTEDLLHANRGDFGVIKKM